MTPADDLVDRVRVNRTRKGHIANQCGANEHRVSNKARATGVSRIVGFDHRNTQLATTTGGNRAVDADTIKGTRVVTCDGVAVNGVENSGVGTGSGVNQHVAVTDVKLAGGGD